MADIADLGNDQAQYLLDAALQRRPAPSTLPSAQFCADCDEEIPVLRRQKVQGCQTCVSCQEFRERRR